MSESEEKIPSNLDIIPGICERDHQVLTKKGAQYGDSWKKRGGVGAFMMLARKWDRLENFLEKRKYDIFEAALADSREESLMDDIQDLRRYLLLVESEVIRKRQINLERREDLTGQDHPHGFPGVD